MPIIDKGKNTTAIPVDSTKKMNEDGVKKLIQSHGIYDRLSVGWDSKFSRRPVIDPYNSLLGCREYVFITKPDLCIFSTSNRSYTLSKAITNNDTATVPFFRDVIERYRDVALQLQYSKSMEKGPFMNILSNTLTSSVDIPGISANVIETSSNIMGTKISYRGTSYKSDEDLSFNLEFEDNKYLDIYMLFKIYDEYEKLKWEGKINYSADGCERWKDYILNKVLHDQMSIFKFIVADDGYRILHWSKITGCFPTSVPRDAFSDVAIDQGQQKISTQWTGQFVRDMDPITLAQFNQISMTTMNYITNPIYLPLYNTEQSAIESEWARIPVIEFEKSQSKSRYSATQYYLRWVTDGV